MDVDEVCSRLEILDLISEYTLSNDRAEWERMDRIWADDAVMLVPGVGVGRYDGRETIMSRYRSLAARAKQAESARDEGKTAMTFSRHHLTSTRLSFLDSSHAVGVSYYFVITDVGYDHSGCYEDRFTRTAGRWLISERKTLVEHVASESFYGFLRAAAAQNSKQ